MVPQVLLRTEPLVCFELVMCLKHEGHVHVVLGPGLLSMSLANRRRGVIAGFSFLGVEKICNVVLCIWGCLMPG